MAAKRARRGLFGRLRLWRDCRDAAAPEEAPAAALVNGRGLGEPSAPGTADDAELDSLRGELVRELDRMAAEGRAERKPQP
jgi:hypothetical protein